MKKGIVYWIHLEEHDDPSKHGYIGVTCNLLRRLKEHRVKKENSILTNVYKKHKNVKIDILFEGEYEYCFEVEKQYRPKNKIGWNINLGGLKPPNVKGIKRSLETKEKMSLNNVGFRGKKHSDETKKKMSFTHKKIGGKPHTEETKKKLSEIAKKRKVNPMLGKKHSDFTRQLISEKAKLRYQKTHTQGVII